MKPNWKLFVAGALCGALAGTANGSNLNLAKDGWPAQPQTSGNTVRSFKGPFPPYGAGSVFERGGYWFSDLHALEAFHNDRNSLPELINRKEILEISPGRKITLLETFVDFEGRAKVEGVGNGYVLLHDWL
jgi:hypothetical protein